MSLSQTKKFIPPYWCWVKIHPAYQLPWGIQSGTCSHTMSNTPVGSGPSESHCCLKFASNETKACTYHWRQLPPVSSWSAKHCPAFAGLVVVGISLSTFRDIPVLSVAYGDSQASFYSFTGIPHLLEDFKIFLCTRQILDPWPGMSLQETVG